MAKQQTPKLQNTSSTDTRIPIKGMTKDLNTALVGKENYTHAINAINNSKDGDVGTLGNEPANIQCSGAPYTIIGTIHLYGDKWVIYSTNNTQSEIGTWDDSQCLYETVYNDQECGGNCLNFNTHNLITGASKENFDCSWQVYWDDGLNPSRTLNLDNIPYIQEEVSPPGADCVEYIDTQCVDCEKLRLAPLVDIPCIKLSRSNDGGQLRNGSYQAFMSYVVNDQKVGDYYGISNIQPLFDHEDLLSGLEVEISNLDKNFEYFQLVILSHNQGEIQAKEMGIYSTEQSHISIDYINQALKAVPLNTIPLSTPVFDRSDKMYVVNDYLIRQGPTEKYDFNYQPHANRIHAHWTVTQFDSDYYKKGGNKPTFMRDEVYAFFIRFVYNTGDKSRSYHIPGRPISWNGWQALDGSILTETDELQGDVNNLGVQASNNGLCDTDEIDRVFEIYNTAQNQANQYWDNPQSLVEGTTTDDCGEVIAEGHMAYWESTERYPQDPVRWNGVSGNENYDLCGKPIRHHKFPDETFNSSGPGGFLDRSSNNGHSINILGVKFENIVMPRYSESFGQICSPDNGTPTGPVIPGIVGYEILVGSREGNKSIIAKGISRNMRFYTIPNNAQGMQDSTTGVGMIPNYPFNSPNQEVFLTSNTGFSFNYTTPQNVTMYAGGRNGTSDATFTFHSPETSFNKPFLSPFEIKTYGMTTGTSIGRFRPSEEHPRHKLLRNSAMWVGIMVGIGYAIGQMRGKKMKSKDKPKGLNIGYRSNERDGGSTTQNPAGTWQIADVGGVGVGGTLTPGQINTKQKGNEGVAPWKDDPLSIGLLGNDAEGFPSGNQPPPTVNINSNMIGGGPGTPYGADAGNFATFVGSPQTLRDTGQSLMTIAGAPKLVGYQYDASTYTAYSAYTNAAQETDRGYIGAGETISFTGERFTEAPTITQLLFGIFNFMQFTAEGGQHIIDMIYELVSFQDYAWKYSGHGFYVNTNAPLDGEISRLLVDKARYIGPSIQNLTANVKINNLQRPSTVAISAIQNNGFGFRLPAATEDNSRFKIGDFGGWFNPSQWQVRNIAAHYTALKVAFKNQYGQLDQIKQIPVGCINYFTQEYVEKDEEGKDKYDLTLTDIGDAEFQTKIVYGGDCYINRYTEKVIMPFFWDFLSGQPNGFAYDYRLRSNVPRPLHWMNTAKYDLSELVRYITNFGFITDAIQGNDNLTAVTPNNLHFLDRPTNEVGINGTDVVTGGNSLNITSLTNPGGGGPTGDPSTGGAGTIQAGADGITQDKGGRSLFHVKNGYMYTHINGTQDFFVESTLNMGLRDYEDVDEKRHFDFAEYTDLEAMYHSSIIRKDNFYKYDYSLSKSRFNTQLISFGQIQDRDYDPFVAEKCYIHYPKRLIYSLQAQREAKKDFWRVFLPMNYKDFKNVVNVIKPMSKSGAFVTFPNLAPALFQGVDQLKTDLGTKLTIGDGGLFSQPMQNVVNADEPHEYGSCESSRSVINTPSGLYYISQAQGKIFNYAGRGLENIANNGMKQWFNKYLPSRLLSQYPEMEDCINFIDNPVAGIGCQSVYDPNYDMVYFCKKDYEALDTECIDYKPCEGFVFNLTKCQGLEPTPCCPDDYVFVPGGPQCPAGFNLVSCLNGDPCCQQPGSGLPPVPATITDAECVNTFQENPILTSSSTFEYAPAIGIGQNSGLAPFGNTRYGPDWPIVIDDPAIDGMPTNQGNPGTWHYITDNGNNSWWRNDGANSITDGIVNRLMRGGAGIQAGVFATAEFQINLPINKTVHLLLAADNSFTVDIDTGTGYATLLSPNANTLWNVGVNGIWSAQSVAGGNFAWLSGQGAAGPGSVQYSKAWIYRLDLTSGCTKFRLTGTNDAVGPAGFAAAVIDTDDWNVIQNVTAWENLPVLWDSETYDFLRPGTVDRYECPDGFTQYMDGDFGSSKECPVCRFEEIEYDCECGPNILGGPPGALIGSCPDANNTIGTSYCEYTHSLPPEYIDNTIPISITDEQFFKDVSWTVSYDPKAKAWISFHDWHPDLTIPSLNHFFTTKNIPLETPYCPPGYTFNSVTGQCDPPPCPPGSTVQVIDGVEQCCQQTFVAPIISNENNPVDGEGAVNFGNPGFNVEGDAPNADLWGWGNTPSPWQRGYLCQNPFTGGSMSPDTLPDPDGVAFAAGSFLSNIEPYEGNAYIGMLQSNSDNDVCGGPNGNDSVGQQVPGWEDYNCYYQEGVWQQLVNGNNAPTTLSAGVEYIGTVVLTQSGTYEGGKAVQNNTFAAPRLEIWGGNASPGYQGQNYRGGPYQYDGNEVPLSGTPLTPGQWNSSGNTNGSSDELLWVSPPVTSVDDWQQYSYSFTASQPWDYLFFKIQVVRIADESPLCLSQGIGSQSKYLLVDGITVPLTESSTRSCECPDGTDMVFNDPVNNYPPATEAQCIKEDDNPANYLDPETFDITCMSVECTPLLSTIPAQTETGAIWKHNARCDLFANYYLEDYPWEVELIESVGQVVNTVRSIEYQLESYIYRGNLENNCGDRFHDLDYNFDEAILHNTEQVSGLLQLNLSPKNNAPLITQFPVVTANDIQILYSKEEQKYRFNMFWDVTADRGEFNPNVNEPIFITELNGYIRDLNQANINLAKPLFERKKFRHYWNAVVLRKRVSGNRKMLLKLNNSKLNVSFR